MLTLEDLMSRHATLGRVTWIGLRPERRAPLVEAGAAEITAEGLEGDHRARPGRRAVTLIQWEHLPVIAALAGLEGVSPGLLRRNIAVAGINLLALRKVEFRIGGAILRGTGPCAPCSRMEEALGRGGYSAMRGHGGITAEVLQPGGIAIGDPVLPVI